MPPLPPWSIALILSLIAGLSTGIGSLISLLIKKTDHRFLALSLGFSSGVMLYISFVDLLQISIKTLGFAQANISFFVGILFIMIIDYFIPHTYLAAKICKNSADTKIFSAGLMAVIGIAIHNFPEGWAIMSVAYADIKLALPLTLAIAIHNIPEGIAVAMPIFYATRSRRQSFKLSLLSGLTEPIGALIGILILSSFINPVSISLSLAFVAGIMVFISFDELLPLCYQNGHGSFSMTGIILGMGTMVMSLILF